MGLVLLQGAQVGGEEQESELAQLIGTAREL